MGRKILVTVALLVLVWGCASTGTQEGGEGDGGGGNNSSGSGGAFTVSGAITGAAAGGVTVTLSGTSAGETATDDSGNYSFSNLSGGEYTVTPTKTGVAFNPASSTVTVDGDEDVDFASAEYQEVAVTSTATKDGTVNECVGGDLGIDENTGKVGKEAAGGGCDGADKRFRTFFYFDNAQAGIPSGSTIVSAVLSFKQTVIGTPYTGDTLTIDHVNYGDSLGTNDWDTTPLDGAVATNTTATAGVITISTDLKSYVQSDVDASRPTQFRLSFPDDIAAGNYIAIERGNGVTNPPTLTVTWYQFEE